MRYTRQQKMIKTPKTYKWISTRSEYEWINGQYVKVYEEGYWYDGALALATTPGVLESANWGFYNDGTESGSTIIGSVNTNPTKGSIPYDTVFLARFDVFETGGNASKNTFCQLQYFHTQGTATWTNVTATSSVVQTTSSSLTDGDDTTQRLVTKLYLVLD